MSQAYWTPSALESKCLQHLDSPGSWDMLRVPRPDRSEMVGWRPFVPIFGFNFILFLVLLFLLFIGLEVGSGVAASDIRSDLPIGAVVVALMAAGFGGYSAYLYRRSWNRRAKSIAAEG